MTTTTTSRLGSRNLRAIVALSIAGAFVVFPPVTGDAYVLLTSKWPVRNVAYM